MKPNLLMAGCVFFLFSAAAADGVTITANGDARVVKGSAYEALIAADGSMTSLKVRGQEMLNSSVAISRGTYFYANGVVKLAQLEQTEGAISAKSAVAEVRFEFTSDSIAIAATNLSDKAMPFFIILDAAVSAMQPEGGEIARAPAGSDAKTSSWFRARAKITLSGSTRLWPWEGGTQVWEATLAAKETRNITLVVGTTSDTELAQIKALGADTQAPGASAVDADLFIASPRNLQVFQRKARLSGQMIVSGRVKPECDKIEAKLSGTPLEGKLSDEWQALPLVAQTRVFSAEISVPAGGWYTLEIRALKGGQTVATEKIEKVGMGEIFVGAGQSNSTNCGQERINQTSGMVSSFSGSDWRIANDPQPGCHDNSSGGSFWPAFGDAMYEKYKVPIGIAATGHGGTSVNAWQPKGELFKWMMTRVHQLGYGGFRAVLWHQGESDVGMSSADYAAKLTNIIRGSTAAAGWEFPWFIAQVSYHNPQKPSFPTTREAQKKLWDAGVALEGPDTDTLGGENRDNNGKGIHFSPTGLRAHGKMWAEKVGVYLDPLLK